MIPSNSVQPQPNLFLLLNIKDELYLHLCPYNFCNHTVPIVLVFYYHQMILKKFMWYSLGKNHPLQKIVLHFFDSFRVKTTLTHPVLRYKFLLILQSHLKEWLPENLRIFLQSYFSLKPNQKYLHRLQLRFSILRIHQIHRLQAWTLTIFDL